jgi:cytochrome c oxidase assembly factor CtaG
MMEKVTDEKKIYKLSVFKIAIKYIIQGFIIAIAAYYIPVMYKTSLRKPTTNEIFSISLTAALTMFMLDYFISEAGFGAKLGAGFTIGKNLVNLV